MPTEPNIVSLYDGRIDIKFHAKGHKYFRRANHPVVKFIDYPHEDEIEVEFPNVGEWEKLTSVTGITKGALDKPELYNWFTEVAVNEFERCLKKGESIDVSKGKAKGKRWKVFRAAGKHGSRIHEIQHNIVKYHIENGEYPDIDLSNEDREVRIGVSGILEWMNDHVQEFRDTEHIVYHPLFDVVGTLDLTFIDNDGDMCIEDTKSSSGIYPKDVMQLAFYRKAYGLQHGKFPDKAIILHVDKNKKGTKALFNLNHDENLVAFECAKYLQSWRNTLQI